MYVYLFTCLPHFMFCCLNVDQHVSFKDNLCESVLGFVVCGIYVAVKFRLVQWQMWPSPVPMLLQSAKWRWLIMPGEAGWLCQVKLAGYAR